MLLPLFLAGCVGGDDRPTMDEGPSEDAGHPHAGCVVEAVAGRTTERRDDYVYTYGFDARGDWVRYRRDDDGDGDFEQGEDAERDAAGVLLAIVEDGDDADMEADTRWSYAYGADALLAEVAYDHLLDGTIDGTYTYAYDDAGRLLRLDHDAGADGGVDASYTYAWTEEGGAWIEREAGDEDLDGVPEYREVRTWSAYDVLLAEAVDEDADGRDESETTYAYEHGDVRVGLEQLVYEDGVLERVMTGDFAYDELGRYLLWEYDFESDDVVDFEVEHTWDCDGD